MSTNVFREGWMEKGMEAISAEVALAAKVQVSLEVLFFVVMLETQTVSSVFVISLVVAMGMGRIFPRTSQVVSLEVLLAGVTVLQAFGWVIVLEEAKRYLVLPLAVQAIILFATSLPLGASLV